MKKILITGGTGYIGSHTVVELTEAGFEVIIVDNLSNSKIEVLDGIEKITNKKISFSKIDFVISSNLLIPLSRVRLNLSSSALIKSLMYA